MRKLFLLVTFLILAVVCFMLRRPLIAAFQLLGFDRPKEYIVLLQNNMELRATGGFMGSYARIRLDRGRLALQKIEDIYTPDGQLDGHVDPPWPIQAAFGQGWYKLRDSNWDPDFPTAAKTIEWFFEHGKEPKADGLVAVNLTLLQELLKLTGPVYVVDQPEKITSDNFYKTTQAAVEDGFFPGSIQKRDFLSKLGRSVFETIQELPWTQKSKLLSIGWRLLKDKQILVYSHDADAKAWLHSENFDGGLTDIRGTNHDYLALFESNLGANKANCCIKRTVNLKTSSNNGELDHQLTINYENTNPATLKQPPQYWGGAYVNFLRIGIPIDAKVTSIKVGDVNLPVPSVGGGDGAVVDLMKSSSDEDLRKFITGEDSQHLRVDLEQKPDKGIQFIGFFVLVDALQNKNVEIFYTTANKLGSIQDKQSGL